MTGWLLGGSLLLAAGLPVLAWLAVRRLPPPRSRAVTGDASWQLARRLGLAGTDFLEVDAAVREGRAASPERLRPAAYAFAEQALALRGHGSPRRLTRRQQLGVLTLLALVLAGVAAFGVLHHSWTGLVDAAVYLALVPAVIRLSRRGRRAAQAALTANAPASTTPPVRS